MFARLLLPHLPPQTSAMFVLFVATAEVAAFAAWRGQIRWPVLRQNGWFFLAVGFLVAASTALNYASVAYIDPGTASMLAKAPVLFGLGFGIFWLGDRLTRRQMAGAAIALAGVAVITFQPGNYLRLGALMVVASTFMYALHAALVKKYGGGLDFINFFLFRLAATSSFLALFTAASGQIRWPNASTWLLLALVGTVDVSVSRGLYYLTLRRLKLSLHALVLTASPVVAIGWSLVLFETHPTAQQLLGGAAVLLGVLLITLPQR